MFCGSDKFWQAITESFIGCKTTKIVLYLQLFTEQGKLKKLLVSNLHSLQLQQRCFAIFCIHQIAANFIT
jgi:hypothetical protein